MKIRISFPDTAAIASVTVAELVPVLYALNAAARVVATSAVVDATAVVAVIV